MIKLKLSLLFILSHLIGAFATRAANVELAYTYFSDTTATVTGVVGGISAAQGNLVIPETVSHAGKTYTVKAIINEAFSGCRGITGQLTIPKTVKSIGGGAFAGCSGLTGNLVIPETVISLGENVFKGCTGFTGELVIPRSLSTIRFGTFYGCTGLTGLVIPETVTRIETNAFYGCYGLKGNLNIPASVTHLGSGAFSCCSGFTGDLIIPESITVINSETFYGCFGFNGSLTIPASVTTIDDAAFEGCSDLTGVLTIPSSVTSIGAGAFRYCCSFTDDLVIPESVTSIGSGAFFDCNGFSGLVLPNSLTRIESHVFEECNGLVGRLVIPTSVTVIGEYAFDGCTGLQGVLEIPESVTEIGANAFSGCNKLTGPLVIPNSVTGIGAGAFRHCTGLKGSLTISNQLTTIGDGAFEGCTGLTGNLVLPETLKNIGASAFRYCRGFSGNLIIPGSVETIGNWAFGSCTGFTGSLTIPASVTTIGSGAFWYCVGLKGCLTLSESVTAIGENAFLGCSGFNSVVSLNPVPPVCEGEIGLSKISLEVPRGSVGVYEKSSPWSLCYPVLPLNGMLINGIIYEEIAEKGENGAISFRVFGGNPDQEGVLGILSEVKSNGNKYPVIEIDESAFWDKHDIRKLIIPASIVTIGEAAFSNCTRLVEIVAQNGSETMDCEADVFKGTPVTTLYLGRNTSGLPFAGMDAMTNLTIGGKVTEISSGDFLGCGSISNIISLNPVPPALPDDSFEREVCESATLKVPDEGIFDYILADGWKDFLGIYAENTIIPKGIELDIESIELFEEEAMALTATVLEEDATDKTVKWTTSDAAIATVRSTGLVTAVKPGEAVITAATRNMLTATCLVKVLPKPDASGVSLNITGVEIVETETVQLAATVEPVNAADKTVSWSTSAPEIATVDANGLVTAVAEGEVVITAMTVTGFQATCEVKVLKKIISASGLSLNITEIEVIEEEILQLIADVEPENTTDKTVSWSTSAPDVATVDANGLVTTVAPGKAIITAATGNGLKATCTVIVKAKVIMAASITLDVENAQLLEKNTLQLIATILPSNTTDKNVKWQSSDESIATVSTSGIVTGVNPGKATITATSNRLTATCEVTVIALPSGITGVESSVNPVRVEGNNIITPEGSVVYDINGRSVRPIGLRPGIYIVSVPDGKAVKVAVH